MKNILVIQIRSGEYEKHERECFESVCPKYFNQMKWVNGLTDFESLPQNVDDLSKYSCVIIGGSGEADISQIDMQPALQKAEKALTKFVNLCVANDFPYFGVCFGHQLLAYSLGSNVVLGGKEIGSKEAILEDDAKNEKIFQGLPQRIIVQQAHKDSVESLPEGAILLASSEVCHIQAMKIKNHIYSVQFHAEMGKKEYVGRHELYARLNPETGYSKNLPKIRKETTESSDGPAILNNFLNIYAQRVTL